MFIKFESGMVINTDRIDAFYFDEDRNLTEFYMSGRKYAFLAKGNVVNDVFQIMTEKHTCRLLERK